MESVSKLALIDIEKAFRKTAEQVQAPVGKLVLVTEDLYQKALEVPKECFIDDEPIGKSIGLQWSDDFNSLWLETFKTNLSIMLIDEENGDPIGIRAVRLIKKGDKIDFDVFKDEKLKTIFRFVSSGVQEFFDKYCTEEAFHFLGLAVRKKYRRRGLGMFLMQTAIKFLGNLEIRPYYIKSEGTSNFSKKIFKTCGFDTIAEYKYEDYKENGKVVFDNTGEHKAMEVYGLCIKN